MNEALRLALAAFEDKKAFDIVLLDISKVATFASYFLMCSGDSSRQIQAIADEVEKKLKENGIRPNHVEGYRHAEWILMDYVDLVVHVFSKSARAYYDLERLWRDGKRLDAQRVLNARARKTAASAKR
jgi:ribosome-associated protein